MAFERKVNGISGVGTLSGSYTKDDHNSLMDFYSDLTSTGDDHVEKIVDELIYATQEYVVDDENMINIGTVVGNTFVIKPKQTITISKVKVNGVEYKLYDKETYKDIYTANIRCEFLQGVSYTMRINDNKCLVDNPNPLYSIKNKGKVLQKSELKNKSGVDLGFVNVWKKLAPTDLYGEYSTMFFINIPKTSKVSFSGFIKYKDEYETFDVKYTMTHNQKPEHTQIYLEEKRVMTSKNPTGLKKVELTSIIHNDIETIKIVVKTLDGSDVKLVINSKDIKDENIEIKTYDECFTLYGDDVMNQILSHQPEVIFENKNFAEKAKYLGHYMDNIFDHDILNLNPMTWEEYNRIEIPKNSFLYAYVEDGDDKVLIDCKHSYEQWRGNKDYTFAVEKRYDIINKTSKFRTRFNDEDWTPLKDLAHYYSKDLYGVDEISDINSLAQYNYSDMTTNTNNAGNHETIDINGKRDITTNTKLVSKMYGNMDISNDTLLNVYWLKENITKTDDSKITELNNVITELSKPIYGVTAPDDTTPLEVDDKTITIVTPDTQQYFLDSNVNKRKYAYMVNPMKKAFSPKVNMLLPSNFYDPIIFGTKTSYVMGDKMVGIPTTYDKPLGSVTNSYDIREGNSDGDRLSHVMKHTRVNDKDVSFKVPITTPKLKTVLFKDKLLINDYLIDKSGNNKERVHNYDTYEKNSVAINNIKDILVLNNRSNGYKAYSSFVPNEVKQIENIFVTNNSVVIIANAYTKIFFFQDVLLSNGTIQSSLRPAVEVGVKSIEDISMNIFFTGKNEKTYGYSWLSNEILEYVEGEIPNSIKQFNNPKDFVGGEICKILYGDKIVFYNMINDTEETFNIFEEEDTILKSNDGITVIYSPTSKGEFMLYGKISNSILENDVEYQEPINIDWFKNRYLRVIDVKVRKDIILVIDSEGSCWYLTNTPSIPLVATESNDITEGWKKIPLIDKAFRFYDSETIIIEDKIGGQYLIDKDINISIENTTKFLDSKAPQPVNIRNSSFEAMNKQYSSII